jgi:hypothetical protein
MRGFRLAAVAIVAAGIVAVVAACGRDSEGPLENDLALDWGDPTVECNAYSNTTAYIRCEGLTCYWGPNDTYDCGNGCDVFLEDHPSYYCNWMEGDRGGEDGCTSVESRMPNRPSLSLSGVPGPTIAPTPRGAAPRDGFSIIRIQRLARRPGIENLRPSFEGYCVDVEELPAPPPPVLTISCSNDTPILGTTITCTAQSTSGTVTVGSWYFEPDGVGSAITIPGSGNQLTGVFVTGGTLNATGAVGGQSTSGFVTVTVTDRSWIWGASAWKYSQGTADVPYGNEPTNAPGNGHLCPQDGCDENLGAAKRWIHPNVDDDQGYAIQKIVSGPNKDLWYVSSTSFEYKAASAIRRGFSLNWLTLTRTPDDQLATCRAQAGNANLSNYINWWDFNYKCGGVNPLTVTDAMWDHEFAHYTQGEAVAPVEDPRAAIANLIASNETDLRNLIRAEVVAKNTALNVAIMPQPNVTGPNGVAAWIIDNGVWTLFPHWAL